MDQTRYPQIILPSYMEHLLYTPCTLDMDRNKSLVVNVDIADHFSKDYGALPVKQLLKTKPNLIKIMSFRGIHGPVVHTDSTTINIDTPLGRRKVTLQQYLERAEIDKPDAIVIIADEVSIMLLAFSFLSLAYAKVAVDVGHNRRRKAFQRTTSWFEQSLQIIRTNKNLQSMKVFGLTMADPLDATILSSFTQSLLHHGVDGKAVFISENIT